MKIQSNPPCLEEWEEETSSHFLGDNCSAAMMLYDTQSW